MRRAAALALAGLAAACAPKAAVRPPETSAAEAPAAPTAAQVLTARPGDRSRSDARRGALLARIGGTESLGELLRADDLDGPILAGTALEAYAEGSELKAVLFAQAALGADPGNAARRKLLNSVSAETGIPADPDGILPPAALVQHELARAETDFFERKFGSAAMHCRRALLVSPEDADAWTRLGSAYFAVGDTEHAKPAYAKARELRPGDESLNRFLAERGWAK